MKKTTYPQVNTHDAVAQVPAMGSKGWISGSGVPTASGNPAQNGFHYLNTDNGEYYLKTAGAWNSVGSLHGSVWLYGSGVPAPSLGLTDDVYLDTDNGDIYFKVSGTWTLVDQIDNWAKQWAITIEDTAISTTYGGDGSTTFSALHWAAKSQKWASQTGALVESIDYSAKEWAVGVAVPEGSSKEWATTTGAAVFGGEYSAKEYAQGTTVATGSAKDWASEAEDVPVDGSFSALHFAAKAATSFDTFDDIFLGAKATPPTLDNDSNALQDGALYWDTSVKGLRIYDLGTTTWYEAASQNTTVFEYTATAGQTVFSGLDDNARTLSYTVGEGLITVYANGNLLQTSDYTASDGTSVTLTSGRIVGDSISMIVGQSFAVASSYTSNEMDGFLTKAIGNINNPIVDMPLRHSLAMLTGDGSATFARSTAGTYIDRQGVLQTATVDEPRFEKEGLLIEGASTNEYTRSKDFTHADWTHPNATTPGTTTGPDGIASSAQSLVEASDTNQQHYIYQSLTVAIGETFTLSVFVHAITSGRMALLVLDGTYFPSGSHGRFDVDTGVINQQGGGADSVVMTALDDGWYKCSVTATADAAGSASMGIFLDNGSTSQYNGDGTSGLYLFGAQLEEMPFATSYIPTTTVAVPRTADDLYLSHVNNFPAVDSPVSVLYDFNTLGDAGNNQVMWSVTGLSFLTNVINVSDSMLFYYGVSATDAVAITHGLSTMTRMGSVYDGTNNELFEDGVGTGSPATSTTPTGTATDIAIGSNGSAGEILYGHISNFRIYDIALTDYEVRMA